eukprot:SAG31_NODE_2576_length_5452_cov_2.351018_7_plen_108_part_00
MHLETLLHSTRTLQLLYICNLRCRSVQHERNGGLDWHRNDTLCTAENGSYSADLLGAAAAGFVTKRAGRGPWYLYLPFRAFLRPYAAVGFQLSCNLYFRVGPFTSRG